MGRKGKSQFCNSFKDYDMFGFLVQFKNIGAESKSKTVIGAIFTFIAVGIILESFFVKLQQVNSLNEKDAKMQVYDVLVDVEHIEPVAHKDIQLNPFHIIRKNGKGVFNHSELERYIEPRFYQAVHDYTDHEQHEHNYKEFPTV